MLALDMRIALLALLALIASWGVSMLGAGLWPGLGELASVDTGRHRAVSFEGGDVAEVDIDAGWEKGGLGIVLLPYVRAITAFARRRPVSFFAPDEAAPAWTTAFWLLGIGLVTRPWPAGPQLRAAYLSTAAAFVVVHVTLAVLAFAAPSSG